MNSGLTVPGLSRTRPLNIQLSKPLSGVVEADVRIELAGVGRAHADDERLLLGEGERRRDERGADDGDGRARYGQAACSWRSPLFLSVAYQAAGISASMRVPCSGEEISRS